MQKSVFAGEVDVRMTASMDDGPSQPDPQTPFHIALLGDFSGRAGRGIFTPQEMKPIAVDRDNIDALIEKLGVEVHISLDDEGDSLAISFEELDDFHPDNLFRRLDIFTSLKKLRRDLKDPSSFDQAVKKMQGLLNLPQEKKPSAVKKTSNEQQAPQSDSLLDDVLAQTSGQREQPATKPDPDFSSFLSRIVGPHLVPDKDPRQDELTRAVDKIISELMLAILHHPEFQALEAAWRGVDFLVRRMETGTELKLYLCDICKEEIKEDVKAPDIHSTTLYTYLVEQAVETMGGTPWGVIIGNFHFEKNMSDIETIGRLARIARRAGAPFISAARDHFLGCSSLTETSDPSEWRSTFSDDIEQTWNTLRTLPEAAYVGLVLPGFLLRLPYGENTDPIDSFDFEECAAGRSQCDYLWGNPAIACAYLLGNSFIHNGWQMRTSLVQDIDKLPLHICKDHGETTITPCTEVVMTERAAASIMEKGFMPLLSFLNQDKVRLGRFQSISKSITALAGRWF